MAKESSVAPRERINIVYKPATGGAQEEIELPFKQLVMADFTLRQDDRPLEDRAPMDRASAMLAGKQSSTQHASSWRRTIRASHVSSGVSFAPPGA